MIFLLAFVAASAEMDALGASVEQCDRHAVNPAFIGEPGRRSHAMLEAYRDQESIVADRLALADEKRTLREGKGIGAEEDKKLKLEQAALEDRQNALNDRRMLEGIRETTMDNLRQYFLINCPIGEDRKK